MEYILAQTDVEAKQVKKITLEEIEQLLNSGKMSIVYLDKQNSEKNIIDGIFLAIDAFNEIEEILFNIIEYRKERGL